jgi:hypothetical protein
MWNKVRRRQGSDLRVDLVAGIPVGFECGCDARRRSRNEKTKFEYILGATAKTKSGSSLKLEGGDMRLLKSVLTIVALCVIATTSQSQQKPMSDSEYTAQALSAAPKAIAKDATVVRIEKNGSMRTLRTGTNGFTCLVMPFGPMCNDPNAMAFLHALMNHQPPPDRIGISYMLAGDKGASNTDPYATRKTADNHWIVTGPHLMVFGPGSKVFGYTEAKDPDPNSPYMMWAGTPYEHAMIPLAPPK